SSETAADANSATGRSSSSRRHCFSTMRHGNSILTLNASAPWILTSDLARIEEPVLTGVRGPHQHIPRPGILPRIGNDSEWKHKPFPLHRAPFAVRRKHGAARLADQLSRGCC